MLTRPKLLVQSGGGARDHATWQCWAPPPLSQQHSCSLGREEGVHRKSSHRQIHKGYPQRATDLLAAHLSLDHAYGVSTNNGFLLTTGLPLWLRDKESACGCRRHGFDPWVAKIPWRKVWQPTPIFSIFVWKIPTEEPGKLQFMGLQKSRT